jgi:glyceraldehyde 3-phosphate dehydrogenase
VGIESGFVTTVHSYTNDQNLLDANHSDKRRSRAACLSMIPASTGAARALGLVLPELAGRLDGAAVRVPVANVSMIDFKFIAARKISAQEINDIMTNHANNIVAVTHEELVSCDFNGTTQSAIFDCTQTKVVGEQFCRIVAWYDNEWAFANRMLEVGKLIAGMICAL